MEKEGKIYSAMAQIMKDVTAIGKKSKNLQQGFSFRGIDAVYNELHDILADNGVFTVPEVLETQTEERQTKNGGNLIYRIFKIAYNFYAADGSFIRSVVIGEGMDSGDKAGNKAMSIAHKYCLLQCFCIPTEDMPDPDADTPPESTKKNTQKDQYHKSEKLISNFEAAFEAIKKAVNKDKINEIIVKINDMSWSGNDKTILLTACNAKLKELGGKSA